MAVPLGLLNVRTFPQKPFLVLSELPNLSNPTKSNSTKHSPKPLQHEVIQHLTPLTALTLPFFLDPQDALAVDGELGLLEGRSFALIHPLVMGSLFFYTLYAGYLGWQWRRVRTIQNEINELKKQVKPVLVTPEGSPPGDTPVSPIETRIQQLTEERKELLKGSFKDRHFNAGSILLGFGVLESVGGGVNTYIRTGKLFPGPHLYAGAAITVLSAKAPEADSPAKESAEAPQEASTPSASSPVDSDISSPPSPVGEGEAPSPYTITSPDLFTPPAEAPAAEAPTPKINGGATLKVSAAFGGVAAVAAFFF